MTHFDAIIIGAGQAGPPLAGRLTGAGMTVALVERGLFGGTCVNTGCMPTKTLVASAYAAHLARRSADFGIVLDGAVTVDMARVKARADAVVANSRAGVEGWLQGMAGCTVVEGHARFEGAGYGSRWRRAAHRTAHLHQCRRTRSGARYARRQRGAIPDQHVHPGARRSASPPGGGGRQLRRPRVRADVSTLRRGGDRRREGPASDCPRG